MAIVTAAILGGFFYALSPRLSFADLVHAKMYNNAHHPRAETRIPLETRQPLPTLHPCLLRNVNRLLDIPDDAESAREEFVTMTGHQFFKCSDVTLSRL